MLFGSNSHIKQQVFAACEKHDWYQLLMYYHFYAMPAPLRILISAFYDTYHSTMKFLPEPPLTQPTLSDWDKKLRPTLLQSNDMYRYANLLDFASAYALADPIVAEKIKLYVHQQASMLSPLLGHPVISVSIKSIIKKYFGDFTDVSS